MNAQAQMSGQLTGRVPNQGNQQMAGLPNQKGFALPSQMQSLAAHSIDRDLENHRERVRNSLVHLLQKRTNDPTADWVHKIPEFAKRLEDQLYKYAHSKEDYMNMNTATMEQRLQGIVKNLPINGRPLPHHTPSSSLTSTMIPTPGMQHNANTSTVIACSADNPMITSGGSGVVAQNTLSSGNLLPTVNGAPAVGHNPSFSASDGSVQNRYQQSPINMAHGSGGNNMIPSRQLSQMIPTPGLNNLQQISMISESPHGVGFSRIDSTMVSQQQHQQQQQQQQHQLHQQLHHLQQQQQQHQQKQFVGSQNSRILHALGGQMVGGPRPNMQQKPSPYGFSNRVVNGGMGMIGNNIHMMNGPAASESYMNTTSGGSSNSLQQQFDQQHNLPTSLSQQILPMAGDGYGMKTADLSVSDNLYGAAPSGVSSMNNQNTNPMSLHSKSKSNNTFLAHNTMMQSLQQPSLVKSEFDHSQKMNYQAPQSREQVLQSHHEIQNFQQQSNQPYGQLVQQQHRQHEQNPQQQQLLSKTDHLRQSSITSNFGGQLMSDHGIESHNESVFSQTAEHYQLQGLQSQYQQNTSISNQSRDSQLLDRLASPRDFQSAFSQGSQQMLQANQQPTVSQNDYSSLLGGTQPDALSQGHWHPQPLQKSQMPDKSSSEQHIQEFQQRLVSLEEAQQPRFDDCATGQASTQGVQAPQSSNGIACGSGSSKQKTDYHKQTRWLLFLFHARRCSAPKGACKEIHCIEVQQLVKHTDSCISNACDIPRCTKSKSLIEHYRKCPATDCPVCLPVRDLITSDYKARLRSSSDGSLVNQMNNSWRTLNVVGEDSVDTKTGAPSCETSEDLQSLKRMKVQHTYPSLVSNKESPVSVPVVGQPQVSQDAQFQRSDSTYSLKSEAVEVPTNSSSGLAQGDLTMFDNIVEQNLHASRMDTETLVPNDVVGHVKEEMMLVEAENDQVKVEVKVEANAPADSVTGSKSGKPKIKGVSLTELFTPEQIKEHIRSLRQWVGQSKTKAEKNQAMEMSENSCQLCAVEKLTFEPPPIYCTPCGARIKRNASYYTIGTGDTRHYFCVPCFNEARGDTIDVDGSAFPKAKLEKKKNDEETEEWWVQCDKCEAWQHQICALFNGRRNDGGQAEYTCPNCYIAEIEQGERKPLPQSAVLGAKDLPKTVLSDHIELRLLRQLKQERQDRARQLGKNFDEVPGAEALVVRVVSSVDKKLEVKQRFLEIFQEDNYPTEFPYKSKVVLLFQKIEGVEVCLFGMYVQEFGSECQHPNQRRVYLSYLDSVKYFRPEIRTVTGEALRTFVYHEILIGYLEYCKKRGFTSCYIWACPPLKGEDYILYCHPEIQKTPKSDKLREWYLAMLRKACKENIVVDLINLYDHFFTSVGECKAKVTAARLPYFDGDYWPGAAEDMINQLRQEEDGRKLQKKGKTKKTITKRALKAAGHADLTGNASKDALLMQKLGETICPMKEDFIMVHLQHACNHCCTLMVSGTRWVCNHCKNFQLCDKCFDVERRLEERERHPINSREKHVFRPIEITDVAPDTKDNDEILESEFFDTRQAFLSLCQGNHYQYDTLRRAKHSSMMVLYHLHNPTAPAFVTTCNACHHDIETGQGWRCEICPDFDVCNACYQKEGGVDHPHKLTNHPSIAERDAQNQEAREKRVLQLRKMLDLLVHASQCRSPHCQYPNCRKVKGLFRHGIHCKTRASGGCPLCKKMWYLLQLHARACKVSNCCVPRCKDLKEHLKRLQQQSDSRRRAAVMEMMRQRAAEVAAGTE